MEKPALDGPIARALSIVVFSALIAALPAFAIGLALLDQPGFRAVVEARVCAPGASIGFRLRMTDGRRNQTAHCHGADGVYGQRNVMLPVLWAATRIAWPRTTGVVALVWGTVAIARRGRRPAQPATPAAAEPGRARRITQVIAPGVTRTTDRFTIQVGGGHAELVKRLVSSEQPKLGDVHRLLESLRASGDLPDGVGIARPGGADGDDDRHDDVGASLQRLRALRDEGLINRTEYEERRKAILERG